jgi:putative spermidine/putrescine transport system permease protein
MKTRSPVLATLTVIVLIFMISPMLISITAAFLQQYSRGLSGGLTLEWVVHVFSQYGSTVTASILIATSCVIGNALIGVPCAYALARARGRWARSFEELLTLPVAVPGLATGLALILTYGEWRDFRQSYAFVLVGHMVFTLPFMVRTVSAAFQRAEIASIEEAARSLGAGFITRFLTVLVPVVLPSIVAGGLMVFTLSIGEFNLTWLLHTPLTRTLPVGLADSYASMRIEIGSAYTLMFFIVVLPLLWLLNVVANLTQKRYGT